MSTFEAFPSWRYSADGRSMLVNNPDEEKDAAELGFTADTPAAFLPKKEPRKPAAEPEPPPIAPPVQPKAPKPTAK
jgi:hypothetical protein